MVHVVSTMEQEEQDYIRCTHPYKNSVLYKSFRALLYSMKITGLYFERDPTPEDLAVLNATDMTDDAESKRRRVTVPQVYSTIVLVVIWMNWIRMFTAFTGSDTIGAVLCFKFLAIIWIGLCSVHCTTMFRGSMSYRAGLSGMFIRWVTLQNEYVGGEPASMTYILYRVYIYTSLAWLIACVQFAVVAYGCYAWDLIAIVATPVPPDHPHIKGIVAFFLIIHFYVSCAWTLPIAFQFIICVMLFREYQKMSMAFTKSINKNGKLNGDFEFYRKWHHHVCLLTEHVDGILSVMTAAILASCIVFICLILYALIWFRDDVTSELAMVLIYSFWLIIAVLKMLIAAVGGAIVNHAVGTITDVRNIYIIELF